MAREQILSAVCATLRSMYTSLTELAELTDELSQAVGRQDSVSVRLFLSMRQEEIDRSVGYQAVLRRQYAQLPDPDSALLHQILFGAPPASVPADMAGVLELVKKNRALLDRIRRSDQAVSRRFGGPNSFYAGK